MRGNFIISQVRQFSLADKIKVKSKRFQNTQSSLFQNSNNSNEPFALNQKNWITINQSKDEKILKLRSKKLIIYSYSISSNLLKEVLLKMGFKFVLTNEIRKAELIIGLQKHLKQNFKLTNMAKQRNIPIYSLNQGSFYQISKLIQFLSL